MLVLHIPSDMTLVHHASGLWISLPMLIFIIGGIAAVPSEIQRVREILKTIDEYVTEMMEFVDRMD